MARWITGILLTIAVVALLLYAKPEHLKSFLVLLAVIASLEFFTMTIRYGALGKKVVGAALTGLGAWLILFTNHLVHILMFSYGVIAIAFVLEFMSSTNNSTRIKQTAFFVLGVFYIAFFFGLLGRLCDVRHYQFWLFLTLACTHFADTGAYVVGRLFGKNKLAPSLSPGKTIEGLVGAIIFGGIAAYVVRYLFWPTFDVWLTVAIGLLVALLGVIGDLCESLLKRGAGVKDSGSLIPGHGGILDRLDSLMFTAPVVYFITFWIL